MLRILHASEQISLGKGTGAWIMFGQAKNLCHYQREIGQLLNNGGKKGYVWSTEYPVGFLLVLPWPKIKDNGKLQQPDLSRTSNDSSPSGMKIWVTPPDK